MALARSAREVSCATTSFGFPQRDPKLHPHATDLVNVEAGGTTRHLITVLP
jgi:hypothetical protein